MLQELLALTIVAMAVAYTAKSTYSYFKTTSKGNVCSCSSCPSKSILKDFKQKQKSIKQ